MYPILARYGSNFIYSYTVVMAIGILAAIALTSWLAKKSRLPAWPEVWIMSFSAAILGGRIGYVWFRWDYFQTRPDEIWQIWLGGLAYPTALLGGLLAVWAWSTWQDQSFADYAGLLAPALILVTLSGWLACWFEGCAYGQETIGGLWTADLPDDLGVFAIRLRSQLAGILSSLLAFLFIIWVYKRWPLGIIAGVSLALISLIHFVVGLMRGDPAPVIGHLRLDAWIDGLILVVVMVFVIASLFRQRKFSLSETES